MSLSLIGWLIVFLVVVFLALLLPSQGINNNKIKIPVKVASWGVVICILLIGFLVIVYGSMLFR